MLFPGYCTHGIGDLSCSSREICEARWQRGDRGPIGTSPMHSCPTFEEAWEAKKAEGYQYGRDSLENVRFGWEIRESYIAQEPKTVPPIGSIVSLEATVVYINTFRDGGPVPCVQVRESISFGIALEKLRIVKLADDPYPFAVIGAKVRVTKPGLPDDGHTGVIKGRGPDGVWLHHGPYVSPTWYDWNQIAEVEP